MIIATYLPQTVYWRDFIEKRSAVLCSANADPTDSIRPSRRRLSTLSSLQTLHSLARLADLSIGRIQKGRHTFTRSAYHVHLWP